MYAEPLPGHKRKGAGAAKFGENMASWLNLSAAVQH